MREVKVFVISFLLVFLMVALPRLGIKTPFVSPVPSQQKIDVFNKVAPILDQKPNLYQVSTPANLIGGVEAAADYDQATSYALIDYDTGNVIAQKNLSQQVPIASLTKLMTAVVALDLAKPDELFTYSQNDLNQPATRLAFHPGDKLTLEELLNGMLLTSANDCAQAVEEGVNQKYGGDIFIEAMNEKARYLGLKDTHFENPQGFDGDYHHSSAHDLAVLTHYALSNYPLISQIVAKDHGELTPTVYHTRDEYLNNWNGLLGVYPGVEGVKIGNTDQAGYTTIVLSDRGGKKLLAVLLGAPGVLQRDLWTAELLDYGFSKYGISPANVTEQQLRAKYATWVYRTS